MSKFQGFQTMYGKFQGIEGFKLFARSKQQATFVRHPLYKSAIYANEYLLNSICLTGYAYIVKSILLMSS